ncbi:hypothetical protein Rsub_08422 [Raphidocelis subcapitata]|uniref:Uncharacterized protein n=1 Tax=Raphidocelis subcapitata TaxID=307507 RepID=A0A2V0PC60_9CHLO|nr:hypothetical protein Rsub_08422 [Raphidocelis subcapitata]|eukprot:GBF95460.1 hypothetical protein Rsub_08422 [Raphidocelis subcapitata]
MSASLARAGRPAGAFLAAPAPKRSVRGAASCPSGPHGLPAAASRAGGARPRLAVRRGVTGPWGAHQPGPDEPCANLDALLAASELGVSTPSFDSYALRHLVHAAPAATKHLSSLSLAPGRVLRRYAVRGATGERCVITLDFRRATAAAASGGGASAGGAGWVLARAHGEPEHAALPLGPSRFNPPESVVAAVVAALRDMDAFTAVRFLAPPARARFGGSADRFAAALEAPALRALLLHGAAECARRRQREADWYEEIVRVESVSGDWHEYCFSVAVQEDGTPLERCWLVEAITPLAGGHAAAGDGGDDAAWPAAQQDGGWCGDA